MAEMTTEDIGVLRTRGMKVVPGSRVGETAFEPAPRQSRPAPEVAGKRDRAEKVSPGGLAGWVLGLMARRDGGRESRHLRVLETQALGGRRQLMLVACDGERFLIGTGADRVDTIVRIGDGTKAAPTRSVAAIPVEEPCL